MTRPTFPTWFAVLVLGLCATPVLAQSAIASWDAVTLDIDGNAERISGYYVGYGTTSGAYPQGVSTGNVLSTRIDGLQNGQTYYFVVKAFDTAGNESAWSQEVPYEVALETCDNLVDDDGDGDTDCQDDECPAVAERCDGFDNDCNGTPDDNLVGADCPLQQGVCQGATEVCAGSSGWQACGPATYGSDYEASESRCDGLDNDCDDATDESLTGPACPLQQGVCAGARQPCQGSAGWGACDASIYGADYETTESLCDELDNDCDGSVDEGITGCCQEGARRACSTDTGECVAGEQVCDADGNWSACDGVLPVDEICDQLDNDCDGQTDEDGICPEPDGGTDGDDGSSGGDPGTEIVISGGCACSTQASGEASLFVLAGLLGWFFSRRKRLL